MKMSIVRDVLIITSELGNASLLQWTFLEAGFMLLLEPLLQPLVFLVMHPFPQPLLKNLTACSETWLLTQGFCQELE